MIRKSICTILLILISTFLIGCNPSNEMPQESTMMPEPTPNPPETPVLEQGILPILAINSVSEINSSDEYISCQVTLFINGVQQFINLEAEIRLRGNSTQNFDKKPFRIRFEQDIQLLDLGNGPSKSWLLLAEYVDFSMLRNKSTYDLAKDLLRHSFVSDTTFVEVILNGRPLGVYLIAEQTHVNQQRVNIDESGVNDPSILDTGYLIELEIDSGRRNADGDFMVDWFNIPGYSINPNDIGWWNAHEYATSNAASFYVIKSDAKSLEQLLYIQNYMVRVYDAIYLDQSQAAIAELINIESAVDMYLLQLLTNDMDNNFSSTFMYKDKGGKLVFGPPWDFDLSYGNHYMNQTTDTINMHHLLYDLGLMPWFQTLLMERWNTMRQTGGMLDSMIANIDVYSDLYGAYFEANHQNWLTTRQTTGWHVIYVQSGLSSQKDGANHFKNWLLNRIIFIQNKMNDWQQ